MGNFLKGQFGVMEHLLMAVLLVMIVVAGLIMFTTFQGAKARGTALREDVHNTVVAAGLIGKTGFLVKEDFVFDDSKLTAFTGPYDKEGCEQIKRLVGEACITVDKIIVGEERNDCDPVNFDNKEEDKCNSWTLCKQTCLQIQSKKHRGLSVPANIFRQLENRMDLGLLTVKVPT